jgi:predicted ATPase
MLILINSSKLVTFNYDNRVWEWDLQKIAAMNVSEDVVDFLLEELHKRNPVGGD